MRKVIVERAGLFISVFLLYSSLAQAADHYVRQGASGSATGTDWTNAYASLPSTLVRGDTYYIADGSYSGYDFNDPPSGTAVITIKKATLSDHGTGTGWVNSYGDGQAIFGPLHLTALNAGYLTIDGQFAYGFRVNFTDGTNGFEFERGASNVTLRYIDFAGPGGRTNWVNGARAVDVTAWVNGWETVDYLTVSHCAMHGAETLMQLANAQHLVVEYSEMYDSYGNSSFHQNIIFIQESNNGTFRYNKVHDYEAEGLFFTYGNSFVNISNWYIYGNQFYNGTGTARAVETYQDVGPWGPLYIYNNTFVNLPFDALSMRGSQSSSTRINNNLFYNNAGINFGSASHDYNWFDTSTAEPHGVGNGSNPFINYSALDFHLTSTASARNKGLALSTTYAQDPDGRVRGADGAWDIGAFEFGSTNTSVPPAAPTNVQIVK
jgi:hypothetical protein